MALDSRVATRYAKSLISLAQEKGVLDSIKDDMELLKNTCEENRNFMLLLNNPIINSPKKHSILKELFSAKVQNMTSKFYEIICRKKREHVLYNISKEVLKQYNALKGIQSTKVTTAFPLTEDLRNEFKSILKIVTGKVVQLEEMVDKNIVGGYKLTIGDNQIDDSIQSRLKNLKVAFSK